MPKQNIREQKKPTEPGLLQTVISQLLEQISKRDQKIFWVHTENGRLTKRMEENELVLRTALSDAAGKEQTVQALSAQLAEKEQTVQTLSAQLAEKEQTMKAIYAQLAEKEQTMKAIYAQLAEKEQTVQTLSARVAEKEQAVQTLSARVAEKERAVQALSTKLAEKERAVQALSTRLAEKEQTVQALSTQLSEKEQTVQALSTQLAEKEQAVQALSVQAAEKEQAVQTLSARVVEKEQELSEIIGSKAWQIAFLLRRFWRKLVPRNSFLDKVTGRLFEFIVLQLTRGLQKRNERRDVASIRSSSLFDAAWYLAKNPDVAQAKMDPAFHYLHYGGFEGRDPSPDFSSHQYLDTYPDVKKAKVNPLLHYLKYGKKEGREYFKLRVNESSSSTTPDQSIRDVWLDEDALNLISHLNR